MSAVVSIDARVADSAREADRDRVVKALRNIAMDIGQAGGLLRLGAAAPEGEVERIAQRLRDNRAWLHFHADRLAAVSREMLA